MNLLLALSGEVGVISLLVHVSSQASLSLEERYIPLCTFHGTQSQRASCLRGRHRMMRRVENRTVWRS